MVSFSTLSQVVENQLQTQFNFEESLHCAELSIHANSYRENLVKCGLKNKNQKINQHHKVRKQRSNCTPWINLVYLSGKGYKFLPSTFVITNFKQIPYVLLFACFYSMVFDPKESEENKETKVATL